METQWFFCCLLFVKPKSKLPLYFPTWFPFAALFCSASAFLPWVCVVVKYVSVRDDFGKPAWYRGDFFKTSQCCEKRLLPSVYQGSFHHPVH